MKAKVSARPWFHWIFAAAIVAIAILAFSTWAIDSWTTLKQALVGVSNENEKLAQQVASISSELVKIQEEDQFVKNKRLEGDMRHIETTYKDTVTAYEQLLDLKAVVRDTKKYDDAFAKILDLLSGRNYATAAASLTQLKKDIALEQAKVAASFVIPANVAIQNAPPPSGYRRQRVELDAGDFLVDIIAGDLSSTRVLVDTASNETCKNDCPVLALSDYVSRSGAYAGINGSYFCPASYPTCAGKTNSFDTLLMNKNKVYFNSDNNVYSVVPAVIFSSGSVRFISRSLDWGRDTGIDSMIANQPLLVSGGNVVFGGDDDPKKGSVGPRSFVANKGNTVYIGVVHNATVAQAALVLKGLAMDNALNLDSGGSTALWSGGYKVGPGRNIPNAILFVRK